MKKIVIIDMTIGKIGEVDKKSASCVTIMFEITFEKAINVVTYIGGRTCMAKKRYIMITPLLIFNHR